MKFRVKETEKIGTVRNIAKDLRYPQKDLIDLVIGKTVKQFAGYWTNGYMGSQIEEVKNEVKL